LFKQLEARKQELQFAESAVISGCLSIPGHYQ